MSRLLLVLGWGRAGVVRVWKGLLSVLSPSVSLLFNVLSTLRESTRVTVVGDWLCVDDLLWSIVLAVARTL